MSGLKELVLTKDYFLELVERWQSIWMNQKQNSKEDYENYWRRAIGVDANMRHHLADMIAKDPLLLALVEIAETLESLGEYAANIQRNHHCGQTIEHKFNPDIRKHAKALRELGYSLRDIEKILRGKGITVSFSTLSRIFKEDFKPKPEERR